MVLNARVMVASGTAGVYCESFGNAMIEPAVIFNQKQDATCKSCVIE